MRQTVPPRYIKPIIRKENKGRSIINWSLVHEDEVKSWKARANNVLKIKGKSKGGEEDEEKIYRPHLQKLEGGQKET